ncbi:MAG: SGNH/GDSL hydrolase family protein [bacterium]
MRRVATAAAMFAIALALFGVLEAAVRVRDRIRFGRWMVTPAVERYVEARRLLEIVMPHPYLIGVLRPGGATAARGRGAGVNSHGYRGAEFASPKPPGVVRVLAIGGSTTFDVCVTNDDAMWPRQLEKFLAQRFPGTTIEVVNGGHPGYTTIEMLLKLQIIDLDIVQPDVVVVFAGLNDLQPSAAPGFRADYTVGHAEIQRRFLGFESRPPALLARSLLLAKIHAKLGDTPPEMPDTPRSDRTLPEAEAVYRERLGEIARVARARGADVVFVTQQIRFGPDRPITLADSISAHRWLPYLTVDGMIAGMARYNAITREVADSLEAPLVDVAANLATADTDFADYCHWTDEGAAKMARFVAAALPESLIAFDAREAEGVATNGASAAALPAASR